MCFRFPQIARIFARREARLSFRGWNRICMHAASLNAAEGALATATATSRAKRAEAIEKEAKITAENAEAWRETVAASPELAAAREQAQRQEIWENTVREQKKRRMKTLVSKTQGRPLRCYVGRLTPELQAYMGSFVCRLFSLPYSMHTFSSVESRSSV